MNEKTRKHEGITLIALIVTIVVLLVLAGISVTLIMRENLIRKAQDAKEEYESKASNEALGLDAYEEYLNQFGTSGGNSTTPPTSQEYFNFSFDATTKTATLTGIKDNNAYRYQSSTGEYYNTAIKKEDGTYITDIVIPSTVKDENEVEYTVTKIRRRSI